MATDKVFVVKTPFDTLGYFTKRRLALQFRDDYLADHPGYWGEGELITVEKLPANRPYGEES